MSLNPRSPDGFRCWKGGSACSSRIDAARLYDLQTSASATLNRCSNYYCKCSICAKEVHEALHQSLPDTQRMIIGKERLLSVTAPPEIVRHATNAHDAISHGTHVVTYPVSSALGSVIHKYCLPLLMRHHKVEIVHESEFAAGIKELVLAGLGMAWLPEKRVERELRNGMLVQAPASVARVALAVAVYRKTRSANHPVMEHVWECLRKLRVD